VTGRSREAFRTARKRFFRIFLAIPIRLGIMLFDDANALSKQKQKGRAKPIGKGK
jgi:hypothetical protein